MKKLAVLIIMTAIMGLSVIPAVGVEVKDPMDKFAIGKEAIREQIRTGRMNVPRFLADQVDFFGELFKRFVEEGNAYLEFQSFESVYSGFETTWWDVEGLPIEFLVGYTIFTEDKRRLNIGLKFTEIPLIGNILNIVEYIEPGIGIVMGEGEVPAYRFTLRIKWKQQE